MVLEAHLEIFYVHQLVTSKFMGNLLWTVYIQSRVILHDVNKQVVSYVFICKCEMKKFLNVEETLVRWWLDKMPSGFDVSFATMIVLLCQESIQLIQESVDILFDD